MRSAEEIKLLIDKFNDVYENSYYAAYLSRKECLSKEQKEAWEKESERYEVELATIAERIKSLNPSKYMMGKYDELEYILTFA